MLAALLAMLLRAPPPPEAPGGEGRHPGHLSYTEMEYQRERGCFEVAMRLVPEDLEQALRWRGDRRLRLEDEEQDVDARIVQTLREDFVLTGADGTVAELRWIGKELSLEDCWLYFELRLPGGYEGARLRHELLFALFEDQVHALRLWEDAGPGRPRVQEHLRGEGSIRAWRLGVAGCEPIETPRAAPEPRFDEPRLRTRFERCIAALPELLFLGAEARAVARPADWSRRLLDHLQRDRPELDEATLHTQLAIARLSTGHLDSGLEHLRRSADTAGVVRATAILRAELDRARALAEEHDAGLAAVLDEAARRAQLEL